MPNPIPKTPFLGSRLRALFELIEQSQANNEPYHTLWDCCCDHGYLGINLLHKGLCQHLHFNDQVPHLINGLQERLSQYPNDFLMPSYSAAAGDAGQLRLNNDHKNLIIFAGIGGEHTVNILKQIVETHHRQTIDFLFCPTTTQFDLREYLAEHNFDLLYEALVTERGRDYEVIHARLNASKVYQSVSRTGEFWQADNNIHQRYLRKIIHHYQRRTQGNQQKEAQRVLGFYRSVILRN